MVVSKKIKKITGNRELDGPPACAFGAADGGQAIGSNLKRRPLARYSSPSCIPFPLISTNHFLLGA